MWSNWGRKIRPIIFDLFRPICNMLTNWSNAYFRPNVTQMSIRPICSRLHSTKCGRKCIRPIFFFDQMVLYQFEHQGENIFSFLQRRWKILIFFEKNVRGSNCHIFQIEDLQKNSIRQLTGIQVINIFKSVTWFLASLR